MTAGSTLDPDAMPDPGLRRPPGHDTGSLGPSDRSDTGSDSVGPQGYDAPILAEDADSVGTGVDPSPFVSDDGDDGPDIGFDRIVAADEAGLGGGLDQAEEARYGVTDEALDPVDEAGASLEPDAAHPPDVGDAPGGAPRRGDRADDAPVRDPAKDERPQAGKASRGR